MSCSSVYGPMHTDRTDASEELADMENDLNNAEMACEASDTSQCEALCAAEAKAKAAKKKLEDVLEKIQQQKGAIGCTC